MTARHVQSTRVLAYGHIRDGETEIRIPGSPERVARVLAAYRAIEAANLYGHARERQTSAEKEWGAFTTAIWAIVDAEPEGT